MVDGEVAGRVASSCRLVGAPLRAMRWSCSALAPTPRRRSYDKRTNGASGASGSTTPPKALRTCVLAAAAPEMTAVRARPLGIVAGGASYKASLDLQERGVAAKDAARSGTKVEDVRALVERRFARGASIPIATPTRR